MDWIGRIVCTVFGGLAFHLPGAVLGFVVGYFFDRARANFRAVFDPETRQQIEIALFNSVFPLMGCMAKADGRVSEQEIQAAEGLMTRMQLSPELRKEAIRLFKHGSSPEYELHTTVARFMAVCGAYPDIKQILLVYLIAMATSDGHLDTAEVEILRQVGRQLGYSDDAFEHLLRMAQAQGYFYEGDDQEGGSYQPPRSSQQELSYAYAALGVDESDTDDDIKKAYRKLISQFHPDKLMGQGVPEDMIKVATERTQEIHRAYDLIRESRK